MLITNVNERTAPPAARWALQLLHSDARVQGLNTGERMTLLAIAAHVDVSLHSGDGYNGVTPAEAASLTGVSVSTASSHMRSLSRLGLVLARQSPVGVRWRIPNEVLDF